MMRHRFLPLAALAALAFAPAARAASDQSPGPAMERMQRWADDHEAFLDAKLAGLKAGLKLTADQDKLWPPFETAVRDAAKLHMEQMKSMMERMHTTRQKMQNRLESEDTEPMIPSGEAISPVDRLEALGRGMSDLGGAIEKIADAAKPLYASLDDSQKRRFAMLGRALFMMGHGHHGMDLMDGGMGITGQGDASHEPMMGGKSDRMERMGHGPDEHGPDDEEDNSNEQ
jgi:hypothetical protein